MTKYRLLPNVHTVSEHSSSHRGPLSSSSVLAFLIKSREVTLHQLYVLMNTGVYLLESFRLRANQLSSPSHQYLNNSSSETRKSLIAFNFEITRYCQEYIREYS